MYTKMVCRMRYNVIHWYERTTDLVPNYPLVILDTIPFSTNEISKYKAYQYNNWNLAVFIIICIDLSHDVIDSCVVTFDFWYNGALDN